MAERPAPGIHTPTLKRTTVHPDNERYDKHHEIYSRHYNELLVYNELETPHTKEPFKAKALDDPNIHYHDFSDFPPDFYKPEFYGYHYEQVTGHKSSPHTKYEPLKIHSVDKSGKGFYYYDEHYSTSFLHGGSSAEWSHQD